MGGWLLCAAATGMWVGVLLEGLGHRGPALGVAVTLLLLGGATVGIAFSRLGRSRYGWLVLPVVATSFALIGAGWGGLRDEVVRTSVLARLAGRSVELEGSLGSDPHEGKLGWNATMNAGVLLPSPPEWSEAVGVHGLVWIEGRHGPPHLQSGDRVSVSGVLEAPSGDFGDYLHRRGYSATLSVGHLAHLGPPASPLVRAADQVRGALERSVARALPPREGGLLLGLALGDTSRLDAGIEESFRATGLSHLTAVSGENVAMFLAPILGLATWLGLGRRSRFFLGVFAIGFFVVLTRAEPSVLRAAVMSGLAMLGLFLGRPRSPPAIVGAAVLVLLAVNPALVYAIGFQLSVAATAGMALFATPLAERMHWLPNGLALAAGTTLGAQAGVTPLLLYHFGIVPTVTLPANLLAFPAVGPGMLLGLLAAATGVASRPAGLAVAALARIPLGYLEGLASRLARSPLPSITSSAGRWGTLLVELAVVAVLGWWIRSGLRPSRRAVVAVGMALPLFVWAGAARAGAPSSLTVTFFSVGWGDSALVRSPGGAAILIDGGPDPDLVVTKLAALGIRRIDLMVATHPHADHVVGLPAVLARFPVALAADPGCRATSPFYLDFLKAIRDSGVPFVHPRRGATLHVADVRIDVLGPEHCFHGTHSDPNNDSLVLRISDGPATVLFGGDAEQSNQTELMRDEAPRLPAPLVKWPHHGGNTNLDQFYTAVRSAAAVISTGPNLYGDPAPSVLAELRRTGIPVYRTDYAGDITASFQGGGLTIESANG